MTNGGAVTAYPLTWPEGWPRTSVRDQRRNAAWRRAFEDYYEEVEVALRRMSAPKSVISTAVRPSATGRVSEAGAALVRDPGVAVYFDRPYKEEFRWMTTLMLTGVPTEVDIEDAWRRLALPHHPDRGGDLTLFQAYTEAKQAGRKWLARETSPPSLVIACDSFEEVRWNLCAVALSLKAIRQLERCGTSQLLERTFQSLQTLLPSTGTESR
jgi:hypothetical protein